jgi:hypothetical protein
MRTSPLALVAACLLGSVMMVETGCSKKPAAPVGIRNSDGSITNPDGSVTYPPGVTPPGYASPAQAPVTAPSGSPAANASTASGPAPIQQQPAPVQQQPTPIQQQPAPVQQAYSPAPVRLTVPAGTSVTIRTNGTLSASRNEVGDRFSGTLERALVYHGQTIYRSGTPVSGTIVASKGKGRFKGAGDLGIELTAIGDNRIETSEYEKVAKGRGKRTAGFIGGGGGLGALIGGLAGGGKGALIGGLAGAGAGTAATAYTGNRDVVIPAESVITFRLRSSLTR